MNLLEQLQGPLGGLVAFAFGSGAAAGYSFAMRTVLVRVEAMYKERVKHLEERIKMLEEYIYK